MAKFMISVIIGGSGSGKSEYAENYILKLSKVNKSSLIYIATMQPFDKETRIRIKKHQKMREDKNFTTIECYHGLGKVIIPPHSSILLECMSNLVANEMFSTDGAVSNTVEEILSGVEGLIHQSENLVIVTNNIFEDGISYDSTTLEYMKVLGQINQSICNRADQVIEVIHGIPMIWKKGKL